MAAVAVRAKFQNPTIDSESNMADSDMDAEGEDDPDVVQDPKVGTAPGEGGPESLLKQSAGHEASSTDGQTVDGVREAENKNKEPEEESASRKGNSDEDEPVRPPKPSKRKSKQPSTDKAELDESTGDEDEDSNNETSDSSGSESEADEDWERISNDGDEEGDGDIPNRNNCVFCGQDEEHDPSDEFEMYLACTVCGDNAHRQCAREGKSFEKEEDAEKWRCPSCVENALQPDLAENTQSSASASAAASAGLEADKESESPKASIQPDARHPSDAQVNDGPPAEGLRILRKRKASHEADDHSLSTRKRRREASSTGTDSDATNSKNENDGEENADRNLELTPGPNVVSHGNPSSRRVSTRIRRFRGPGTVRVVEKGERLLVLAMRLQQKKLTQILNTTPKPKKFRRREFASETREMTLAPEEPVTHFAPALANNYVSPFYSLHDQKDDFSSKPFGGILSEADADTSKTLPNASDRARFEDARQKAEDAWQQKQHALELGNPNAGRSHRVSGPPSKIKCVNFGGYEIDTWYAAPYPEEYSRNRVLYICEFCLKYMNSDFVAWRHKLKCPCKHPPGDEIYRDGSVSVFEVDGRKNPVYCQNLCLLAKLFLGSKTLYYDVEPFLFYVMTEYDDFGCHFVGYFSKEKRPTSSNNVSCILTLPIHQRKGYGNLLIDFSYLLTRVEQKTGSPEKPLSDMGLVSYRNYWRLVLSYQLIDQSASVSIQDISERTGMTADDIVSGLENLRALVRDPITKKYALRLDYHYMKECIEKWEDKDYVKLKPECLVWVPYVMGRSSQGQLEHNSMPTVAPREDEEEGEEAEAEDDAVKDDHAKSVDAASTPLTNDTLHEGKGKGVADDVSLRPSSPVSESISDQPGTPSMLLSHFRYVTPGPPNLPTPLLARSASPSKPPSLGNRSPLPDTLNHDQDSIPPTRYEIYPPVPGNVPRRRPGRPFGTRRRPSSTPGNHRNPKGGKPIPVTPTVRVSDSSANSNGLGMTTRSTGLALGNFGNIRTRSKLGEVEMKANYDDDKSTEMITDIENPNGFNSDAPPAMTLMTPTPMTAALQSMSGSQYSTANDIRSHNAFEDVIHMEIDSPTPQNNRQGPGLESTLHTLSAAGNLGFKSALTPSNFINTTSPSRLIYSPSNPHLNNDQFTQPSALARDNSRAQSINASNSSSPSKLPAAASVANDIPMDMMAGGMENDEN